MLATIKKGLKYIFWVESVGSSFKIHYLSNDWEITKKRLKTTLEVSIGIFILVLVGIPFEWTGFGETDLFKWLEIALIPIAIGIFVSLYESNQLEAEKAFEEERNSRSEKEARENRSHNIFESYVDRMTKLVLDYDDFLKMM